jgi:hypothetical protein
LAAAVVAALVATTLLMHLIEQVVLAVAVDLGLIQKYLLLFYPLRLA